MMGLMGGSRRNQDALATLALTQRLVDAETKPFSAIEFWSLVDRIGRPSMLLQDDGSGNLPGTEHRRIKGLIEQATAVAFAAEELERTGIKVLTYFDEGYPTRLRERLGRQAPPLVYVAGAVSLLSKPAIGVVGSRDIEPAVARVARGFGTMAAERDFVVVSGGARGVDQLAMQAVLERGGSAVGVLAEDMTKRLRDADTRRAITQGYLCLLTPYKPTLGFTVANAMNRNKLIYALADRTVVISTKDGEGGTWNGAMEALRRGYGSVYVWVGQGTTTGNQRLQAQGALGISSAEELFDRQPAKEPVEQAQQLRMGM
jgi:predicted Rossmann fold nucleotide-binding protein DprA/Smf involved in DNA uptake